LIFEFRQTVQTIKHDSLTYSLVGEGLLYDTIIVCLVTVCFLIPYKFAFTSHSITIEKVRILAR